MQPVKAKPTGSQDRPLLQVGDFVKVKFEGEEFIVSVKERIGSYVILSNGARFHILDDRWKQKELWIDESTGFLIAPLKVVAFSTPEGSNLMPTLFEGQAE
jgi:hypothetical protein